MAANSDPVATQPGLIRHRNHFLFSDYYLDHRVRERPEWRGADLGAVFGEVGDLWRRYRPSQQNEAQTEEDWIRPMLRLLGHSFNVQVPIQTPLGARKPDYVLFPDEATRRAAADRVGVLTEADLRDGLAVADAKAWDRPLDRALRVKAGRDAPEVSENPSFQIDFYIRHTGLAWGVLTNGRLWRLYHRDTSKKLDVFYEVDLPALIEQGDVEAFRYFWLFFRREAFAPEAGWLVTVLAESQAYEQGVSDNLKGQVYESLRSLVQGFLDFPANHLDASPETLRVVHDNGLIVLYRLLFLLYAESRGLLPLHENPLYTQGFSLHALKGRVARDLDAGTPAAVSMDALWSQLRQLWAVVDAGNPELGVPAYNGGLFSPERHPFLEQHRCGDAHLRQAIDLLARITDRATGRREYVDYRDLEVRHLGSIYEGLLEYTVRHAEAPLAVRKERGRELYVPAGPGEPVAVAAGQVYLTTDKGERKATGSYYTPDYIVQYIVEHAVGPVLEALRERHADDEAVLVRAVLDVNVLDPAVGSGHFLVAAADYIARYLVSLRLTTVAAPEAEAELAYWRRRVAQACIYGVDLNPLAVELAKLSLWLATVSRDKPLSFLDHHLRCGNSLIGARVRDLALDGAALDQPRGRARSGAKAKQAAAEAAAGAAQLSMLDDSAFASSMATATGLMADIEALPGETLAEVHEAERLYRSLSGEMTRKYRTLADVWTACHFGLVVDDTLWSGLAAHTLRGGFLLPQYAEIIAQAEAIAAERRFFHWELEFPEVFFDRFGRMADDEAGFDAVAANPPYEVLSERERHEDLAYMMDYVAHQPCLAAAVDRKVDLYRLFIANTLSLLPARARLGMIVPMSLLSDLQTRKLRRHIFDNCSFAQIDAFPQKDDAQRRVFPEAKLPTSVFVIERAHDPTRPFAVTVHPGRLLDEVESSYMANSEQIRQLSPTGMLIPVVGSEAGIALAIRLATDVRCQPAGEIFTSYQGEINETTMAHLLTEDPAAGVSVLRGGNVQRYCFIDTAKQGVEKYIDPERYSTEVSGQRALHTRQYRIGYQRNAALNNWRRLIFAPLPTPSYCFDSVSYFLGEEERWRAHALIALMNSRLLNWRFGMTSTNNHVSTGEIAELPIPVPSAVTPAASRAALLADGQRQYTAYLAKGDAVSALAFVDEQLLAQPERSDVVHDLLGFLAERMIDLHKERQVEQKGFLEWLEREIGAKVTDLTNRTVVQNYLGDYQKGEDELPFDDLLTALRKNQRRLTVEVAGRAFQDRLRAEYMASLAKLRPVKAALMATDRLIDLVVYRLYGLSDAEIAVIEGRG